MKSKTKQLKNPESQSGSKPDAKDRPKHGLKSLPLAEVEKTGNPELEVGRGRPTPP